MMRTPLPFTVLAASLVPLFAYPAPAVAADTLSNQTPFDSFRGLWMSRFEYTSAASVVGMIDRAADLGITDVVFQVRGQGDALYTPGLEVRSERLNSQPADFDPLRTALDAAHARGIRLHAWLNMMPVWSGTTAPRNPEHLYFSHPDYLVRDQHGVPQQLYSHYVIANPVLPEARAHVAAVAADIAARYEVDGIHMDYIRYINDGNTATSDYYLDPRSTAMYTRETGVVVNPADAASYNAFKLWLSTKVTQTVREVRTAVTAASPEADLTAAVWTTPASGRNNVQQDYAVWVAEGLVDAVMPMIYTGSQSTFRTNLTQALALTGPSAVIAGMSLTNVTDANVTLGQIRTAEELGANGVIFFSAGSLLNPGREFLNTQVKSFFDANPLAPVTITDFETDSGYFGRFFGATPASQTTIDRTASSSARTDERSHTGDFSQKLDIVGPADGWILRHVTGLNTDSASPADNLPLENRKYLGLWLLVEPTGPDADLRISLGLDDPATNDRSLFRDVIADGQWHLYEWDLGDPSQWDAWLPTGNGTPDGRIVTLDSLHFTGRGNVTFFLDDVYWSPYSMAPVPEPAVVAPLAAAAIGFRRRRGRVANDQ